jgi:hypothetical protein
MDHRPKLRLSLDDALRADSDQDDEVARISGIRDATLMLLSQHLCCILFSCDQRSIQAVAGAARLHVRIGQGGHQIVRLGPKMSVLPMHGSSKELGTGLVNRIKKDLGLK